jgi:hypothetical protein
MWGNPALVIHQLAAQRRGLCVMNSQGKGMVKSDIIKVVTYFNWFRGGMDRFSMVHRVRFLIVF